MTIPKSRFCLSPFIGWETEHKEVKECACEYPTGGLGMAISKPVLVGEQGPIAVGTHLIMDPSLPPTLPF